MHGWWNYILIYRLLFKLHFIKLTEICFHVGHVGRRLNHNRSAPYFLCTEDRCTFLISSSHSNSLWLTVNYYQKSSSISKLYDLLWVTLNIYWKKSWKADRPPKLGSKPLSNTRSASKSELILRCLFSNDGRVPLTSYTISNCENLI